jgi:glycosyltransferase involved in cell wall biosynthesis
LELLNDGRDTADRRPRLLILVTLDQVGGVKSYVAALLPGVVERFDVVVAAHGEGPLRDAALAAGARYVPLRHVRRSINPGQDILGLVELVRLCRRFRPDIVHANSAKAGLLGRLAAFIAGVPIRIFNAHGWAFATHPGRRSWVYLWGDRIMRPLTTTVICVAENEVARGLAAGTCNADRTVVIRNGIELNGVPTWRPTAGAPVIVTVGRLHPPKDFVTFVRALAALDADAFRAVIVGDGPDRAQIEAEIRRLGLGRSVELVGRHDAVPELLAESDIFALSSTSEAMPMTILEAMAAALPIVASAVGGVPELVVHAESGLLVPQRDPDALAGAIGRLLADPELRRRLGSSARARAETLFDLSSFRQAHVELYRRELSKRGLPLPAP